MLGIRGVMANPKGEAIEIPIKSCFREGLSISEFFISTHGGRKGVTDTALKTAESGYLTRRLVDVSQSIVVREDDCHADHGFVVRPIISIDSNGQEKVIVSLQDRLIGRYAAHDIVNPQTGEVIVRGTIGREYEDFKDDIITKDNATAIVNAGINEVEIRSVLCCNTRDGVCKTCYGLLVATNSKAEIGDAVGIMAGQSIGEPGTQLTMRTFHSGGVAGDDIVQGLPRVQELVEARKPKRPAIISHGDGVVVDVSEDSLGRFTFTVKEEGKDEPETYVSGINTKPVVQTGDQVKAGQQLTAGSIDLRELLDCAGKEKVQEYILAETLKVYAGVDELISDKHIEIIIRQMFSKVSVENGYDTGLMPGLIDKNTLEDANRNALLSGGQPALSYPVIKGIKDIAKQSVSFLSAASFQETTAALTSAAINHKVDVLQGLKENVIVGKLIPAGTGLLSEKEVEDMTKDFSAIEAIEEIDREYK
jgi:DNA-directed RNA polymerase subunit beta'